MNASKYIISATAALAVVGTIGLAYAQTTTRPGRQRHHRHAAAHVDLAGPADAADLAGDAGRHGRHTGSQQHDADAVERHAGIRQHRTDVVQRHDGGHHRAPGPGRPQLIGQPRQAADSRLR